MSMNLSTAAILSSAYFDRAAHTPEQFPAMTCPEIAFAGRSNSGKSSALNALCNRRKLARVGKTPGRTRSINFFETKAGRLVDLPGYGFARVPPKVQNSWKHLIESYLTGRPNLQGLVLVMDCRRPLTDFDQQMLAWGQASGLRFHLLLTKADKLGHAARQKMLNEVTHNLPTHSAQLFSTTKRFGLEQLQTIVTQWLQD